MNEILSFTTTATNRPEILDRTYNSFSKNVIDIDLKKYKLIINIDPLPSSEKIEDVIRVAKKYFGEVVYNIPEKANFTSAINYLWSKADADYIFHIEDDWLLIEKIELLKITKQLSENENLLQCILRAYGYKYEKMALSPSVIKKCLYNKIGGRLNINLNPEIQLRDIGITKYEINKTRLSVCGEHPIVEDIGRDWIENSGFKKPSEKFKFNSWIKE